MACLLLLSHDYLTVSSYCVRKARSVVSGVVLCLSSYHLGNLSRFFWIHVNHNYYIDEN